MPDTSSKLLEKAVGEFASLPGVGRKTALRYALYFLNCTPEESERFLHTLRQLREGTHECRACHNIADGELCEICANPRRDATQICVVESIKDIMSIEATAQFHGLYHVLGGIISPMDGIGPADLHIDTLLRRLTDGTVRELIFALSATIEGDTTAYYIYKKIPRRDTLTVSTIAKGISIGNDLEYTDSLTLGRSITNRVSYSGN